MKNGLLLAFLCIIGVRTDDARVCLDIVNSDNARESFSKICCADGWVEGMLASRPFTSAEALFATADRIWKSLDEQAVLAAFACHPRIGQLAENATLMPKSSRSEQASILNATDDVVIALHRANDAYYLRFGYIFIVNATGKEPEEMLALLRQRLLNAPEVELGTAAKEKANINRMRLDTLIASESCSSKMTLFESAAVASVKSVAAVFVVFSVSALITWSGIVEKSGMATLAKFTKQLALPCMIFQSLASNVDSAFLAENYVHAIVGAMVIAIGFALGLAFVRCVRVPKAMQPWIVLGIAVPNMVGLPMVLIEGLCAAKRPLADVHACFEHGSAFLFTVTFSHTWIFWIGCYGYVLRSMRRGCPETKTASDAWAVARAVGDAVLEPPVLASLLGLVFGLNNTLRSLLYADQAVLSPVTSTISLFAKTAPGIMNFLAGGALGFQMKEFGKTTDDFLGLKALRECEPGEAPSKVVKAKTFGKVQCDDDDAQDNAAMEEAEEREQVDVSLTTILALAVTRVVVAPAVCAALLCIFMEQLPPDPWGRVIVIVQPAGISASMVTMLAQLVDPPQHKAAQMLALSTIPQMAIYMVAAMLLLGLGIMQNPELQ